MEGESLFCKLVNILFVLVVCLRTYKKMIWSILMNFVIYSHTHAHLHNTISHFTSCRTNRGSTMSIFIFAFSMVEPTHPQKKTLVLFEEEYFANINYLWINESFSIFLLTPHASCYPAVFFACICTTSFIDLYHRIELSKVKKRNLTKILDKNQ